MLGASEGIGRAVAIELARRGARVTIASRGGDRLAAARAVVSEAGMGVAGECETLAFDASDPDAVRDVLGGWIEAGGAPDLAVNCVGYAHLGYLSEIPIEALEQMMRHNYFGQVHPTRVLLPAMIERGRGQLVHTSSMLGFMGLFGYAGYAASKHAVVGFSESLRAEVAPFGVRVSVLCPPATLTPGYDRENELKPEEVRVAEETVKPVSAELVARVLLRALPRNPAFIIPGASARWVWRAQRFVPGLVARFTRRPALGG